MLSLEVDNIWTYLKNVDDIPQEIIRDISDSMSYIVQEYARYRKTFVDFEYTLFEKTKLRYPTGLFSNLENVLSEHNYDYDLIDKRNRPETNSILTLHGKTLRDYQEETVDKAINSERGIIKVATGGGKTVIAAGILSRLNVKSLFIVSSIDLLEQTADELTKMLKVDIGKIGGGECDIQKINVCTIQTLFSALGFKFKAIDEECKIKEKISKKVLKRKKEIKEVINEAEFVIIDECQHMSANSYIEMMKVANKAYFKFGLSGTPYRYDGTDILLDAYAGKEIVNISASYLIQEGYLVKPKIYFLDANEHSSYKFMRKDFRTIYNEWIVENDYRNNIIVDCVERLLDLNKTTLVTVTRVNHGEILLKLIEKRLKQTNVAFIKGEVKKEKRKELLEQVRKRELNVLIGTSLADEGLDLPALDSAIMAGGGKSLIKSLQRVGRTLRPYPNVEENVKEEAIIVDFYDRLRYLTGQSKKRMNIYKEESEFEIYENF